MATKNNFKADENVNLEHCKRILIFQNISLKTTRASLENFLRGYSIEKCTVPTNEGISKCHAIVTFVDESDITRLMDKRPLEIDGREVFIHRKVPGQTSSKDNRNITTLVVRNTTNRSMSASDIEKYFFKYGRIDHVDFTDDDSSFFLIHFNDYDSVDRALLNQPHKINNILLTVEKGSKISSKIHSTAYEPVAKPNNDNQTIRTKPILKVRMDPNISSQCVPELKYCIHITNLPIDMNAEKLSHELKWPIDNILMGSSSDDDQPPSTECWLKSLDDQKEIDKFLQNGKQRTINRSTMQCEKEEDQRDLCEFFRLGKCNMQDDTCHWTHIKCSANGTCSADCPYGHAFGEKKKENSIVSRMTYRIKISGFKKKITRNSLSQLLNQPEKLCYVREGRDIIGYVIHLKTFKYAQHLMKKWHDAVFDGQQLKCQIEINPQSNMRRSLSRSSQLCSGSDSNLDTCYPKNTCLSNNNSQKNSRESSLSRDEDHSEIREVNDPDVGNEGRLYAQALNNIGKSAVNYTMRPSRSTESIITTPALTRSLPNGKPSNEWEIIRQASDSGKKASLVRRKSDRKSSAIIKVYKNEPKGDCYRELTALKLLKGVQGVAQLIEPDQDSNNFGEVGRNTDLWIIMQRALTCSLKNFMIDQRKKYKYDIEVSNAIKFVQNLIGIVKQVHARGILHQNIEPENIVIEYEARNQSIDKVNITLLNFTQAYIKSNGSACVNPDTVIRWYQSPQVIDLQSLKNSATNDTSAIVAILLWLLTDVDPGHDDNTLPHQKPNVYDKLNQKIENANRSTRMETDQLKTYLTDTFNRAFGFPEYEPWTIEDLECRFKCISQLFTPSDSTTNTVVDVFRNLLPMTTSSKLIETSDHPAAIQKAANVFTQVKQELLNSNRDQYSWFDGNCTWLNTSLHPMNEFRHDDILTCYLHRQSFSVIISCFASINDKGKVVTLSIGSTVHSKTIRIPLGQYSIGQDYAKQLQKIFIAELKNLLLSIYNEMKQIEK